MTKQEKAVIYFLTAMLILGLGVKFYKAKTNRVNLRVESAVLSAEKVDIKKIVKEKKTVKINTATAGDFSRLPGIGPGLAKRLVEYRNQNGNFAVIDDIKKVKGIGDKRYEEIKDYLVIE